MQRQQKPQRHQKSFGITFWQHNKDVNTDGISSSIPFPPGYTPENVRSHVDVQEVQEDPIESVDNTRGCNSQAVESSQYEEGQFRPKLHGRHGSGINNNEGGSILALLEDMINVGKTMGFNLAGCAKDMEKIISSQGAQDGFK
ncbi:hypothetical protein Tco_1469373 [Tanacetum coccineum]